jgi:hypothetical protein
MVRGFFLVVMALIAIGFCVDTADAIGCRRANRANRAGFFARPIFGRSACASCAQNASYSDFQVASYAAPAAASECPCIVSNGVCLCRASIPVTSQPFAAFGATRSAPMMECVNGVCRIIR